MSLVSELRILLDEQAGGVFWTDSQVYNALNRAQLDVWAASNWDSIKTTFTVNSTGDIFSFNSSIMIPQYFVINNKEYFPSTMAKLEQYVRSSSGVGSWRNTKAAQPFWFIQFDATRFRVYPKPDATYSFDLWGVRYPPSEISATTADITAPELVKRAVVYRAAALLMVATRPDLAAAMMEDAEKQIQDWNKRLRNRQGHRIFRLKPLVDPRMDRFNKAQMGVIKLARGFK